MYLTAFGQLIVLLLHFGTWRQGREGRSCKDELMGILLIHWDPLECLHSRPVQLVIHQLTCGSASSMSFSALQLLGRIAPPFFSLFFLVTFFVAAWTFKEKVLQGLKPFVLRLRPPPGPGAPCSSVPPLTAQSAGALGSFTYEGREGTYGTHARSAKVVDYWWCQLKNQFDAHWAHLTPVC